MHFFFYGTLISGSGNRFSEALQEKVSCIGPATARGRLYAVADLRGPYPALLPGSGAVYGMLYETLPQFGQNDLARIDAYEEFDSRTPAASLYRRRKVAIRLADGQAIGADAYVYNKPLPKGARIIADGDFRGWLARNGAAGFGTRRTASTPGGFCAAT